MTRLSGVGIQQLFLTESLFLQIGKYRQPLEILIQENSTFKYDS